MPEIEYVARTFQGKSLDIIMQANAICRQYAAQGYDLTLRQLYYQFVSRDLIANKDTEYKRLGSIINDARLAGLLDWDYITDRTRNLESLGWNESPEEALNHARAAFRLDIWADQTYAPEVWIEKDALTGVIERVCQQNRVPFFSCRGYTSQSEMWGAGQRMREYIDSGRIPLIIHLGDHDPSGIDMTRDITDRLEMFAEEPVEVRRVALTMAQIRQYGPPPNPAKMTDSRGTDYVRKFGAQSWELDALSPEVMNALIQDELNGIIDLDEWQSARERESDQRAMIGMIENRFGDLQDRWSDVLELLDN